MEFGSVVVGARTAALAVFAPNVLDALADAHALAEADGSRGALLEGRRDARLAAVGAAEDLPVGRVAGGAAIARGHVVSRHGAVTGGNENRDHVGRVERKVRGVLVDVILL